MRTAFRSSFVARHVMIGAAGLWLGLLAALPGGCDEPAKTKVCTPPQSRPCECPVGDGVQYCAADGDGYNPCICPLKQIGFKPHVVQLDGLAPGEVAKVGEHGLQVPLAGNEHLRLLQPHEYVASLTAGRAGRVTGIEVDGDTILIQTEPRPLAEMFDDLKIEVNALIDPRAHLPTANTAAWNASLPPSPLENFLGDAPFMKKNGDKKTETEIAGTSFTFDGALIPTLLEVDPATHITLAPDIYAKLDLAGFHFGFLASLDIDVLLKLRAAFEAWVTFTAEVEIVEFTMCAIFPEFGCCDYSCAPIRTPIVGAIELLTWITVGCEVKVDGSIDMSPEVGFQASFSGGVFYSDDYNAPIWDDAPAALKTAMTEFPTGEVVPYGTHEEEGYAQLNVPFIWTLHGGIKCYVHPKVELSFLGMGGPYITGGPYVALDAYIERNQLEASVGVEVNAGGEFNPLGQETLFDWNKEIYSASKVLWRYSWMTCGDGMRQTHCPGSELLPCDDCPPTDCDVPPEECDAGPFFLQDGQGLEWANGVESPCIPPGQPGECTCAPGFVHRDHLDVANWEDFPDLHRGYWGDGNNVCVPACGNGQEDPGEVCDHETRVVEDHSVSPSVNECWNYCSSDCQRQVGICGDGIMECWEQCDDGNLDNCDGCNQHCGLETFVNVCGDGRVRCGEACDDGNTVGGDGCSAICEREGCPNGTVDVGEECDDGNLINADGCDVNCTQTRCGNNIRSPGEECDDGNLINADGCDANCTVTRCGNGMRTTGEECDDGNRDDCDDCHVDCTLNTGCGDGHLCQSQGEQCDLGARNRDCGCTRGEFQCGTGECAPGGALCDGLPDCSDGSDETDCDGCAAGQFRCGNGQCVDANQLCDRQVDCADQSDEAGCLACSTDCKIRIGGAYCGDGYVCGTEECDPNDGSGSWTECGVCQPNCTWNTGCGDGYTCEEEACDDGNNLSGDGCSADCRSKEECGNGVLDPGEACDDGNRGSGDGCSWDCGNVEVCGDGILDPDTEICEHTAGDRPGAVDVGCTAEWPHCGADCDRCGAQCGDGVVTTGEVCEPSEDAIDPGCAAGRPSCRADCMGCEVNCDNPVCGDGVSCPGEQCDDGNDIDCDGCNSDCTKTRCGDGLVCGDEVCDDGNAGGGDGCRADCLGTETCGDGLVDYRAGEGCEDTSALGLDAGCSALSPYCVGECLGCTDHLCGNALVEPSEVCDGNTSPCVDPVTMYNGTQACLTGCGGWADCVPQEGCGDGVTNGFEECDDGNHTDCDGCNADCTLPTGCGDGVRCGTEECDDGNHTDCDGCNADCTITRCGDGIECGGEVCDDGNNDSCVSYCSADCSHLRAEPVCGDGVVDSTCGEVCENSSPAGQDLGCGAAAPNCSSDCRSCVVDQCGDGVVTGAEECDDGGFCDDVSTPCTTQTWQVDCAGSLRDGCFVENCDGCSTDCKVETFYCGDGTRQCYEQCDDGNNQAGDGCSPTCVTE